MFQSLGQFVTRYWWLLLAAWAALFVLAATTAPEWTDVAVDGELTHLPADVPTRVGGRLHQEAFPEEIAQSSVVLVVYRNDSPLREGDRSFVTEVLVPGLEEIAQRRGGLLRERPALDLIPHEIGKAAEALASHGVELPESLAPLARSRPTHQPADGGPPRVVSIASLADPATGPLLSSADGHATLVVIQLTSSFLETRNTKIIEEIQSLLDQLRHDDELPKGLRIDVTGSAAIGADTIRAITKSTKAVRRWAIWIAVALLFVVFRAPVAAVVPLISMFVAVEVALWILAWAAYYDVLEVFDGLKLYVSVIVYGAGVDYSLFLLARQEEELRDGVAVSEGVKRSLMSVGTAISASAGTEIVGIGLLATARFGKFEQAGVGIALGLAVLLIASLTLTASILCLTRRLTFWPQLVRLRRPEAHFSLEWMAERFWRSLGRVQRAWPGTVLLGTVVLMAPMAVIGYGNLGNLRYGVISGLPEDSPSSQGTAVLRRHFNAGTTGPITLVLQNKRADFSSHEGIEQVARLTAGIRKRSDLGIVDVRSLSAPLGNDRRAKKVIRGLGALSPVETFLDRGEFVVADTSDMSAPELLLQEVARELAYEQYVSHATGHEGTVTRLTLIPADEPFGPEGIERIDRIEDAIADMLSEDLAGTKTYLLGAAPGLRDVRDVTQADWQRIRIVIPLGVFLVLYLMLRRPVVSGYLVITVIFSFLVTYGVTYSLFQWLNPTGFEGIEWTVPVLLFTLLVAIGEDYSVLLVTRTDEERLEHSPSRGVTEALVKTGGLISGAGLIMAGTFSALLVGGTLDSMRQLGFALCFGVLVDTFVVRPLLVPSFLDLLARWKLIYHRSGRRAGTAATSSENQERESAAHEEEG
jgi:RND superfamily putative drug exporter